VDQVSLGDVIEVREALVVLYSEKDERSIVLVPAVAVSLPSPEKLCRKVGLSDVRSIPLFSPLHAPDERCRCLFETVVLVADESLDRPLISLDSLDIDDIKGVRILCHCLQEGLPHKKEFFGTACVLPYLGFEGIVQG
jgi:hypothetical protein